MTAHWDYLQCFLAGAMTGGPVIAFALLLLRARRKRHTALKWGRK
jgi:hypothetical protein